MVDLVWLLKHFPPKAIKGFFIGCGIGLITWSISSALYSFGLYKPLLYFGSVLVGLYGSLFYSDLKIKGAIVVGVGLICSVALDGGAIRRFFGGNEKELVSYILSYGFLCLIFGASIDTLATWNKEK